MTVNNVDELANGASALVELTGTNQSCSNEPVVDLGDEAEQANCISTGNATWCTEPDLADQNCGYFNEEYVCLKDVPTAGCTFYGSGGGVMCEAGAPSPPAPDDGTTPGTPATPDSTIASGGTTYNSYNNTTVNNSTAGASGTQQGDGPSEAPTIELDFSEIIEQEPSSDIYDDSIESDKAQLESEMDSVISELSDPNDFTATTSLGTTVNNAFGYSACADISISAFGHPVTFACSDAQTIRDFFGWIARVLFLLALFHLLTARPD